MAGFVGYYRTNNNQDLLDNMMDKINHRGPDYRLKFEDNNLSLGYVGLDLKYKNDRKELYEDDKYVVLLNGYMQNEEEVVSKLKSIGFEDEWTSHSHMIARLYESIGDDFSTVIKGSFIVIIYMKTTGEILILRDVFGVQPIFYYPVNGGLIFASEAKALLVHPDFKKEFNEEALRSYLVFQSPSLKESFFKGAYKLKEASILRFKDGKIEEKQYWDTEFNPKENTLENVVKDINESIGKSLEQTTTMGEEIGAFLSGGVDSSYITSRYRPNKAFTIGFEEGLSEIDDAKALTELIDVEHVSAYLDPEELFNEIPTIQYFMDEPLSNFSAVAIYFLSRLAREHVKVVLGGEGADEFFGGYFEYIVPPEVEKFRRKAPKFIRKSLAKVAQKTHGDFRGRNFLIRSGLPVKDWYIGQPRVFNDIEASDVLKAPYKYGPVRESIYPLFSKVENQSELVQKQYVDFHYWMINDINLKADRMTMAHSLQLVTPIVSRDVFEVAAEIPDRLKIEGDNVKVAFREAANDYVPQEWANRPKLGFPVPFKNWLTHEKFSKIIEEKVTGELAAKFFEINQVKKIIEANKQGKRANYRKIIAIYMFLTWYEQYFVELN